MLNWLKNLLFEEEEDVVDEAQLEQINFDNVKEDFNNILLDSDNKSETYKQPEIIEQVKVDKPKSFGIELEPAMPKKEAREVKEARETVFHSQKNRTSAEKPDVVINTVISPIFGGSETDKKVKKTPEPVIKSNKKKDVLGVISPIYGQSNEEVHEVDIMKDLVLNPIVEEQVTVTPQDDYTLDDIIVNEEIEDECVQISLFGDEQKELTVDEEKEGM